MKILGYRVKKRIISLPLIALFTVLVYIVFIEEEEVNRKLKESLKHKAEFTIKGFKLFESQKDGKDWNLKATYAEIHRNKNRIDLEIVNLTLFNNDGKIFKLYSDKAILYTDTKKVILTDNIKLLSDDGYIITTDRATFYSDKQIVQSDSEMVFDGPDLYITGKGFKGDIAKKRIFIFSQIVTKVKKGAESNLIEVNKKSSKRVKDSSSGNKTDLTINSGKCDFDFLKNQVVYTKNVIARGKNFTLNTNTLIINYEIKNGVRSLKDILASGSVRITNENKVATSGKAYLLTSSKEIILTKEPVMNENENIIKGEKIIYNYLTKKTQVRGASGKYLAD